MVAFTTREIGTAPKGSPLTHSELDTNFINIAAVADAALPAASKDATGGVPGLTLFKINFKNALNTFTSFFTNSNTAARTYTFPDRDGTIADNTDLATKQATLVSATNIKTINGNSVLGSGDLAISTAASSIFLANNFGGF